VRHFQSFKILALAAATVGLIGQLGGAADLLTIGSNAPELDVEHWVQNGNGKFKPVTKFESGKVYVVEFWATWCGPCIQSMPHLAALQTEYAEQGVQLISISDEDLETVDKFLQREVRGPKKADDGADKAAGQEAEKDAKPKTYRELTSVYCLTTDPDQSSNKDYREAAAQNGIPTAFVVGKDGKIEWIGHPMEMDGPLAAVVNDKWDRAAFQAEMKAKQEAEQAMQEIQSLAQGGKFDEAVAKVDALLAKGKEDVAQAFQLKMLKLQLLLVGKKNEAAAELTGTIFADLADKSEMVNGLAWNLYEMAAQGGPKSDEVMKLAVSACEKAAETAPQEIKASLFDTSAHLVFLLGDKAKALKLEEAAIAIAEGQDLEFMKQFLAELKGEDEKPAQPDK
jgi:thiol-disulfide isomerase/thioredoxin